MSSKKTFLNKGNPAEAENPALGKALNGLIDIIPPQAQAQAPKADVESKTQTSKLVIPPKKTRNQHIQLLITEETKTKLKRLSEESGLSVNEIINQAIDSFLT